MQYCSSAGGGLCALLPVQGAPELLPPGVDTSEVFKGPVHSVRLRAGWRISWSCAGFTLTEVNERASALACQIVKGDACLHQDGDAKRELFKGVEVLLGDLGVKQPAHSSTHQQREDLHMKRSRSAQHIAAAHCAHQRILAGMRTAEDHSDHRRGSCVQQQQQQPPPPQLLPSPQQQQHSALPVLLKSQQKWDGSTGANPVTGVISCTPWSELSECVVGRIALFLSSSARDVLLLASACRCWRRAVLENDALLATLHFALKDPLQPLRRGAGMELLASSRTTAARTCQQLLQPELLVRAASLGNPSALVCRARLLDAAGQPEDAMRCWRRAAKAGCLEGLLRYGTALYRGSDGVPQDAQDAHIMLSRALRCALALPDSGSRQAVGAASPLEQVAPPSQAAQAARDAPAAQAAPSAAAPPAAAVVVLTGVHDVEELRIRVVRRAGLLLGYLAHDGEGVRQDACEAVRCFQLAAEAGCGEAAAALGWSWNTGQY